MAATRNPYVFAAAAKRARRAVLSALAERSQRRADLAARALTGRDNLDRLLKSFRRDGLVIVDADHVYTLTDLGRAALDGDGPASTDARVVALASAPLGAWCVFERDAQPGDEIAVAAWAALADGRVVALVPSGAGLVPAPADASVVPAHPSLPASAAVKRVLEIAVRYGQTDGEHHARWVIDQIVRVLAGDDYDRLIADVCAGEDGPHTYSWDVGIAP